MFTCSCSSLASTRIVKKKMGVKKLIELMGQVLVDVSIGALIADKLQRNNKSHAADVEPRQDPVIKLGVDASCPIHNLLRRHAKDIILRSSWLSFRSSVRQLLDFPYFSTFYHG